LSGRNALYAGRAAAEVTTIRWRCCRTTLSQILEFVEQVPFDAIRFILEAARLNDALSREGLSGKWGLHIGATLINSARADGWRRIWVQTLLSAPARPRMPEWAARRCRR
jgi:L-cysteine desulfidase